MGGVADKLAGTMAQLNSKVEELANRPPQVVVSPPAAAEVPAAADVSDQEIENAILSGQGAAGHIRSLIDRSVAKATSQVIEQHVKPLQDYGINTLSELTKRVTTSGMPDYNRFKKEIDTRLNELSPEARANPVVIETVYHAVVGAHKDELIKEATEAALRQHQEASDADAQGNSPTATPGTAVPSGGNRETDADLPDLETYTGSALGDAVDALNHKGSGGQDADEFARGMGYESWDAYMRQYQELIKAETGGSA